MQNIQFTVRKSLRHYVNCIMVGESKDPAGKLNMPLYADGYPGIMFQNSTNGLILLPRNKKLSELFLYGQTLDPITITADGTYRFVVMQLYPFASKYLLNVDPKILNDDCYDLLQLHHLKPDQYLQQLNSTEDFSNQIEIMSDLIELLIDVHQVPTNDTVQKAIQLIMEAEGQVMMKDVQDQVYVTERTLERNFMQEVGLTPKQFAKIIQFQSTLDKLGAGNHEKFNDIGLDSGFADQSHFIRTFKKYTGLNPGQYVKQMTSLA
ncbi:helix-turn-helix domain-containing protein [Fulvivirga ligni]|uniref:helix-turn-helix domain-containing protein n=1 Tax=Fulvivirga ligni TaxID=2904246 RepID=UPI001F43F099|nr:helix-turn-helix domain-containing protein [Fulvivirga ligni]UII21684.1 helix-turn-helix domain-containing protein [Fulvivirga ligni]